MANNNAANVVVGMPVQGTGAAFRAPIGTPLPTNEATAKNAAFHNVGYIGSDGVTRTIGSDKSEILAAGGDVVRVIEGKHKVTYKFVMIETNPESLAAYYGTANVTITPGGPAAGTKSAVQIKAGVIVRDAWIFEIVDGARVGREVVPNGEITGRGDTKIVTNGSGDGVFMYDIEITAYADTSGVKAYEYWDDHVFIP